MLGLLVAHRMTISGVDTPAEHRLCPVAPAISFQVLYRGLWREQTS